MSESTEELKASLQGASEVLTETRNMAEQLNGHATELAEEAAGHGWHGIATRMHEVAEALEASATQVSSAGAVCDTAVAELGLINDKIPAGEVAAHLGASTNHLREAGIALEGGVEKG